MVTFSMSHKLEAVLCQYLAQLTPRQGPQFSQKEPQSEL